MALTRHSEGGMRELWHISFPLMLSSLTVVLMIFVDRLLLAHYSTDAMNAAVNASTRGWAFLAGWMGLGCISEVFVAQYNGSNQPKRIGEPVWQMIWVGLLSILFFAMMAEWGGGWFYGHSSDFALEREYFRWMMYFGFSFGIYGALTGFFVGRGQTRIITLLAFLANFVNGVLDYLFIFGLEGWIPSMGVKGAAIATSFSGIFQMIVLFILFIRPKNRDAYSTWDFRLKLRPLMRCLRIGLPGAVFIMVEIYGWSVYYDVMKLAGRDYITVAAIAQSVLILMYFFAEGLSKGATALAGNYIGAKKHWNVHKVFRSGMGLNFLFLIFLGALFSIFSDPVIDLFLPDADPAFIASIHQPLVVSIFFMIFHLYFEGIRFLLTGILTAAGDTLFLFISGSLFMWIFLVLPVYLAVLHFGASIAFASFLCAVYSAGAAAIYYWRFIGEKWKSHSVIEATKH